MPPSWTRPKNIILMVLDSLRHDGVGFSQDSRFQARHRLQVERRTPTLDRLARRSTVFTQAFSTAGYATAAHASLFTSKYPSEHRVETAFPTRLSPDVKTLASYLREANYRTIHAVDFEPHFVESDLNRGAQDVIFHDDRRVFDLLRRHRQGFFLFAHFGDIHAPYLRSFGENTRSKVYSRVYNSLRERFRVPELEAGFVHAVAEARIHRWPTHHQIPRWVMDDFSTLKLAMQLEGQYFQAIYPYYQQGINQFDQGRFARFMQFLEQNQLLENTLLIITSDYGEAPFSDNHFDHGLDLSDGVLHVPLIIHYEGVVRAEQNIHAPVSLLDLTPTILDFVGMDLNSLNMRGQSLQRVLATPDTSNDRGLYSENWRSKPSSSRSGHERGRMLAQRALRTDRFKLVIQGRDLEGDERILTLVDPNLSLDAFVDAVNHRYLGLANTEPLSTWLQAYQQLPEGQDDVLTDVLGLARQTLGPNRYQIQHTRRLRSYLANRFQKHWQNGTVDIPSLVRDTYEVYFLDFPTDTTVHKLAVLVEHHCRSLEDVLGLFQQMGPPQERYLLYNLEHDPFEETNLFATGLSVVQERDALAMEILLLEAYLKDRSLLTTQISSEPPFQAPSLQAIG